MKLSLVLLLLAIAACYYVSGWALDQTPVASHAADSTAALIVEK